MIMEMQHTYEEQQSHMDVMIRQVALLAKMIEEVKENRAKSEVDESAEMEEGAMRAEEKEPVEEESEALPEEGRVDEIEADEKRVQTEERSIITPPRDDVSEKILGEAYDESHWDKEAIACGEKIGNTSFYFQSNIVHAPEEKGEKFTILVKKEESTPAEEPPPVIDQSERCSYEGREPEWKEDARTRRKAARTIYWVQLQPWPEPRKNGKPPRSGVRPKENKKVLGTYRHHRKRQGVILRITPENSVDSGRRVETEFPSGDHSQGVF